MTVVIGCDPGTNESALVSFNGETVCVHGVLNNALVIDWMEMPAAGDVRPVLVLEQVESFGMPVGREVFETVFWTGRFAQCWSPRRFERMPRRTVKQHICHTARATDANIRTELIDRFGGSTAIKKGGPLYGVKSHCWAALALAVTYHDLESGKPEEIRTGVTPEF